MCSSTCMHCSCYSHVPGAIMARFTPSQSYPFAQNKAPFAPLCHTFNHPSLWCCSPVTANQGKHTLQSRATSISTSVCKLFQNKNKKNPMHEMSCGSRYIQYIYFVNDNCYCNFIDVYTFPHNIPTDTLYSEQEAILYMMAMV